MDIETRIAQFENMVQSDPLNDMAHFSLAGAYSQAGRPADAAASYRRCIELNPGFSKAYQLAGAALVAIERAEEAGALLEEGHRIASERGDLMPKKAMAEMLAKLGRPVQETAASAPVPGADSFICRSSGRPGTRMNRPPFRGPVGEWIAANISRETFDQWIGQGTKVINELRLDLSRDQDSEVYDQHMREFLGIDEDLYRSLVGESHGDPAR